MKSIVYFLILSVCVLIPITAAAQVASFVVAGAATKIVTSGAVNIVLNNTNYVNNASSTHFTGTASTVSFIGASSVALTVSSSSAFTSTFGNVSLNRTHGISLLAPMVVSSTFSMISGNVSTTATNLLTVGTSTASPGSVAWTLGTVVGPMKRYFSTTASSTQASGIFPVGNSTNNRYAQVNFTSNPGTAGFIIAEYKSGLCPIGYTGLTAIINGSLITNYEDEGYWSIAPTGTDLNITPYNLVLRGKSLSTVTSLPPLRIIKSSTHLAWNDNILGDGNHVAASGSNTDFTIGANGMLGFSWFNIGSPSVNPLPVDLTGFNAHCNDKNVDLKWSTASESNSQKFIVQKSRDLEDWSMVSTQPAAGNSSINIDYSSIDLDPYAGTFYYRLIQVDNNGIQKIYGPISISCKNPENGMTVFPNPSNGAFTVEISSTLDLADAKILVLDLAGKLVAKQDASIHEGNNQVMLDGMHLSKGAYIVQLASESEFKPVKVVIN